MNEQKTKSLTITGKRLRTKIDCAPVVSINGNQLPNVSSAKLLGLEIDSELSFVPHIDKLCKKLAQRIGILRKIRTYLPLKQRILYYNSMIKPVMNYVNVIWSNCDQESLGRVLKLQKRAARVILNANFDASSVELFNKLKWLPFYEEAKIRKCCIVYKRRIEDVPSYLINLLQFNYKITKILRML